MNTFLEMLQARWAKGLFVCVGLDSEVEKIPGSGEFVEGGFPESMVLDFNKAIIDATADLVCAFKPNIAFYEDRGYQGIVTLAETIEYIKDCYPGIPVILDSKRGDIGNTNNGYVRSSFDYFEADAITINPYLGAEANKPFLDCKDKGIIVLCRTSNPGAGEFQDRLTYVPFYELENLMGEDFRSTVTLYEWRKLPDGVLMPLYQYVALNVARKWNINKNCAIVTGATYPKELGMLRSLTNDLPFLIPGIGAQGGDVEKTIKAGMDSNRGGMIINSSRGIIFASRGNDFAEAARKETIKLTELIKQHR